MRLLVCGGRSFDDAALLNRTLDELHAQTPVTFLINGGQRGADTLAQQWANANHIQSVAYPPEWRRYHRAAGPIRNTQMLREKPDLVVAFKGGDGTRDMIRQSAAALVPYKVIE
jgi:hypothetical protein